MAVYPVARATFPNSVNWMAAPVWPFVMHWSVPLMDAGAGILYVPTLTAAVVRDVMVA